MSNINKYQHKIDKETKIWIDFQVKRLGDKFDPNYPKVRNWIRKANKSKGIDIIID